MIKRILLLGLTCLLLLGAKPSSAASEFVDGGRGDVEIHLPSSHDPNTPTPLLILLHGYSWSGASQENAFQLLPHADTHGYLYAFPNGRTDQFGLRFWDGTDACCSSTGHTDEDSDYMMDLVDAIEDHPNLNVDPRRIFFIGFSNGGFLAHALACKHSQRIAAIMSVSGSMYLAENVDANPDNGEDYCKATQPVHVAHVHGTNDGLVPFSDGELNVPGFPFDGNPVPGAATGVGIWRSFNNCLNNVFQNGGSHDLASNVSGAETGIRRYPAGCHVGGSAELWVVSGGAHENNWNNEFGVQVFNFFNNHPKQQMWFSDRDTIEWMPTPIADSYRMYRGSLDELVDQNGDGLPDQEYGECITMDPAVDNFLVDTDTPLPEDGYFYARSYVDDIPLSNSEGGLGKTSAGEHRLNMTQCP
jgi:polyhydroxybutyrate depolymerase